jgi:hypothetical protein
MLKKITDVNVSRDTYVEPVAFVVVVPPVPGPGPVTEVILMAVE